MVAIKSIVVVSAFCGWIVSVSALSRHLIRWRCLCLVGAECHVRSSMSFSFWANNLAHPAVTWLVGRRKKQPANKASFPHCYSQQPQSSA